MIKIVMVDAQGLPAYTVVPGWDGLYTDGEQYGDHTAIHIPYESDDVDYLNNKFYKNNAWKTKSPRPSDYHDFDPVNEVWVGNLGRAKEAAEVAIKTAYDRVMNGIDPVTNKPIYVDCVASGKTFRMNTGEAAAQRMDAGVRLMGELNSPVMPVVRDFYNQNHANVSIGVAKLIRNAQALDAMTLWGRKGELMDQVSACTTVDEVLAVAVTFEVNVEE